MASSILAPGQTPANSSNITVGDGDRIIVAIYITGGGDAPAGPVLRLQRQDINGNFMTVSTPGYGQIFLNRSCQQLIITTPGVYRVNRPDITNWNTNIGVQLGV